jgi:hypothetical protein
MIKGEWYKVNNLLEQKDIDFLQALSDRIVAGEKAPPRPPNQKNNYKEIVDIQEQYGRICIMGMHMPEDSMTKLNSLVSEICNADMSGHLSLCVEYNPKYGKPDLPPHFDGDGTDVILNYQLSSNTSWSVGVDTEIVPMEDNSAVIFSPNASAHWRIHKTFNEDEFVRMVFFRFFETGKKSDHSHLRLSLNNPVFDDIHKLRDSLPH